jgi:hypothetical protein
MDSPEPRCKRAGCGHLLSEHGPDYPADEFDNHSACRECECDEWVRPDLVEPKAA